MELSRDKITLDGTWRSLVSLVLDLTWVLNSYSILHVYTVLQHNLLLSFFPLFPNGTAIVPMTTNEPFLASRHRLPRAGRGVSKLRPSSRTHIDG